MASNTALILWLLTMVIEDAKSEAPIEVPVVSTETNVGADGSSVTALPEAPDVSKSTEDREKATKSGVYGLCLHNSEYSG